MKRHAYLYKISLKDAYNVAFMVGMLCLGNYAIAADLMPESELSAGSLTPTPNQVASIYQSGYGNDAAILQQGSYNSNLIIQKGNLNVALSSQRGSDHDARIIQNGSLLEASIQQTGYGLTADIVQSGYGKEATINQYGAYGVAEVHQLSNQSSTPVTITQFSRGRAAVQVYQY